MIKVIQNIKLSDSKHKELDSNNLAKGKVAKGQSSKSTVSPADGFDETWSTGKIDPDRWDNLVKRWGDKNNHGCVSDDVSIQKDIVDGKEQNVLVLEAHGDQYKGPVKGLKKHDGKYTQDAPGTRVGGGLVSKQSFDSGTFEVKMKLGEAKDASGKSVDPKGLSASFWLYGYQEHYAKGDPSKANPDDPEYQPNKTGVSTKTPEIDMPETGKGGKVGYLGFTTYNERQKELFSRDDDGSGIKPGKYFTLKGVWHTSLVKEASTKDGDVIEKNGYYYVENLNSPYQREPVVKNGPNDYSIHKGTVKFFLNGKPLFGGKAITAPYQTGHLNIAAWLPQWTGPATWVTSKLYIAEVKVTPTHDPGDYIPPETRV